MKKTLLALALAIPSLAFAAPAVLDDEDDDDLDDRMEAAVLAAREKALERADAAKAKVGAAKAKAVAAADARGPGAAAGKPGPIDADALRTRIEKKIRLFRLMELTDALDLPEPDAVRINEAMGRFDDRRRPLQKELGEQMKLIRRAAEGDPEALRGLDAATVRAFDLRAQIAQVNRELFQTVGKDLQPQKRARFALFLGQFDKKVQKLAKDARQEARRQRRMREGKGGGDD
jgi:hypothetical protein